jgi:alpha-amylase
MQSDYYRHGFDAMINFDYQEQAAKAVNCLADIDLTWQQMAEKLQSFNVLSYLSSHDTRLFREGGSARRSCSCWHLAACKSITAMNPNVRSARQAPTRFRAPVRI